MEDSAKDASKRKPRGNIAKNANKKRKGSLGHHIRGIERLLAKIGDDMTPAARRAKEAELESCRALQRDRARRAKETEMSKKYRMVKFFERAKVERQLKRIAGKTDAKSVERRHQLARDLRYITEFPKDCKYISLYPSGGHTETSKKQVEEMRKRIEGADAAADDITSGTAKDSANTEEEGEPLNEQGGDDFFLPEEEEGK